MIAKLCVSQRTAGMFLCDFGSSLLASNMAHVFRRSGHAGHMRVAHVIRMRTLMQACGWAHGKARTLWLWCRPRHIVYGCEMYRMVHPKGELCTDVHIIVDCG